MALVVIAIVALPFYLLVGWLLLDSDVSDLVLFCYIAAVFLARPFLSRLVERGNALRQIDAMSLLEIDRRPPILYLRSFDDDELADLAGLADSSGLLPIINTYELRLKKALANIGPMISIGRPGEALPQRGSSRFYVSDAEWRVAIQHFLERVAAVVIVMGPTEGLMWEVEMALRRTAPDRLLFFFPYVPSSKRSPGWWYRFALGTNLHSAPRGKDLRDMVKERDMRYQLLRDQVLSLGRFALPASLEDATFLTFTREGKPRLLPSKRPLLNASLLQSQPETEIHFDHTLRPFVSQVLGEQYKPPVVERLKRKRGLWIATLILSLALICFSLVFLIQGYWPVWMLMLVGGIALLNISIAFLKAAPKSK